MRIARVIFCIVAVIGFLVIVDVLSGTLLDLRASGRGEGDTDDAEDVRTRKGKVKSRRKISSSLKERHPALQDAVGGKQAPPRVREVLVSSTNENKSDALTVESGNNDDTDSARGPNKSSPSSLSSPAKVTHLRFSSHTHNLINEDALRLMNSPDAAIDLKATKRQVKDATKCDEVALESIKDEKAFEEYADLFTDMFNTEFEGVRIPWFLDEGGLIGVSRSGTLRNADDDFDFFALLPNQTAPCAPHTTTCTNEEYHAYIHRFLMVFWNRGMCINKFHPDPTQFKSNMRLMYSLQLNRDNSVPPERCYKEHKPFAHMHLGIMVEGSEKGEIETNIWARHTTHPIDKIPMSLVLPTTRCKVGRTEAPCPRDIVGFLKHRNRGEYFKKSSDGSCLLIRNKWSKKNRIKAAETVANLDACGYNTMVSLLPALIESDYTTC